jgi:acylphosphatase
VAEFVAWCRHGPGHARVTDVELTYGPATGAFASFEIAYGLDPDVWNP